MVVWISLLSVCGFCRGVRSAEMADRPKSLSFGFHESATGLTENTDSLLIGVVESRSLLPATPEMNAYSTLPSLHRRSMFRELGHDVDRIARDPAFYFLMAGLVITPSLLPHEDPEIDEHWSNSATADNFFELGNMLGNGILPVAASGAALTYGKLSHRPGVSDFGSDLLRAQIVNGILSLSLKRLTGRQRPDGTPWSFPSGHTSTAFASATVVYRHYGWKFGIPALAMASYVGMSRLQENKHYLSDVIAGAVLGGYVGFEVTAGRDGNVRFGLAPVHAGTLGIEASVRF